MLAARVLSDHFDDVIVLERHELPGTATARQVVPQARHAHRNVRIRHRVDVDGLIRDPGDRCGVAGVRLWARPADRGVHRMREELAADLVVVADGRNSRLPDWLVALGYEPPQETVVNSFQGYTSRRYRPAAGFKADWKALYIQQAPPDDSRGGLHADDHLGEHERTLRDDRGVRGASDPVRLSGRDRDIGDRPMTAVAALLTQR
jgi:hypothetical protein